MRGRGGGSEGALAAAAAVPTEMNTYMFSNGKGKATNRKSFKKQKARQRVTGGDRNIEQSWYYE